MRVQGAEDEGQHAQVRPDLPFLVHRPRQAAQQGPYLPLSRQQMLHRLQVTALSLLPIYSYYTHQGRPFCLRQWIGSLMAKHTVS